MKKENIKEYCRVMFDFKLTDYQLSYADSCINQQYTVGVFCRQSGKSETTAKVSITLAGLKKNSNVLIFAPTDRQTGLIAEKITNTITKFLRTTDFHITRQTSREFYFNNGSKIICETVGDTGENIRGYTADVIILEEAGSIKDSIVHSVIMPMGATTNAKMIKIGTPRGMNHFYDSYKSGQYAVHQITWREAVEQGIVRKEYVDEVKSQVPLMQFQTEMEAMFIPDADAYFSYELVDACKADIQTLEAPRSDKTYYLGGDIARLGQDSTCLMILERDTINRVVKIIDIPKSTLDYVIDLIIKLDDTWHFKQVYIDETGLGAGVRDVLAKKYNPYRPTIGFRELTTIINDKVVGVRFTLQSKIDIYSNLKVLMESGRLLYPDNKKLVSQLRDFRYETTDSGNVKLHHSEYGFDDYCDALALAVQGVKTGGSIVSWG